MLGWVDGIEARIRLSPLFDTIPAMISTQLFPQLPVQGHSHHDTHSDLQLACIDSDDLVQELAQGQGVGKALWERSKLVHSYDTTQRCHLQGPQQKLRIRSDKPLPL